MINQDQQPNLVRKPHFAGKVYPADPVELTKLIVRSHKDVKEKADYGPLTALVTNSNEGIYTQKKSSLVTHLLEETKPETVVILAQSEHSFFDTASVYNGGAYDTPIGRVFLDLPLAQRMANIHPKVVFSNFGHTGGRLPESQIELLLPVLQWRFGSLKLVPIFLGNQEREISTAVGEVLASTLRERSYLIVACCDLSFSIPEETEREKVKGVEEAIEKLDWSLVADRLSHHQPFGIGALLATLYASRRIGIKTASIVRVQADSGSVKGDQQRLQELTLLLK